MVRRGDLVVVVIAGDFGKPRPALVTQSDQFDLVGSVSVLPLTSHVVDAPLIRVTVAPSISNGLRAPSQVMIDKMVTVRRDKIGTPIGCLDDDTLLSVTRSLAVFLGIA